MDSGSYPSRSLTINLNKINAAPSIHILNA